MKNEEKKTTAKTTAAKKPATKSTASKTAAKSTKAAVKAPAKKPAAKRTAAKRTAKPKPVTIDKICGLIENKIDNTKAKSIKGTIAVDIEVWGFEDGSNHYMYIEIKDGNVSVMPHSYDARDFRVSLSFANAMEFANGKIDIAKLLEAKDFYAEGNIAAAVRLASVF